MPSSFTSRLRLEQQAAGENLNTWGAPKLNNVIARLDFAIAGRNAIVLVGGTYVLSASNGDDEARGAMLDFTGTAPASVTLPSVSKIYLARNSTSGAVTLTSGSGTSVILDPGIVALVACDGTNVFELGVNSQGLKAYVDAQAWAGQAGTLPGQTGNGGKLLKTNGTSPNWAALSTSDLTDYATDQATRAAAAKAFAIAAAVAL